MWRFSDRSGLGCQRFSLRASSGLSGSISGGRYPLFGGQLPQTPVAITSQQQSERPELTADRSTARQQQIRFVPAPFMLRFALLPAFSF